MSGVVAGVGCRIADRVLEGSSSAPAAQFGTGRGSDGASECPSRENATRENVTRSTLETIARHNRCAALHPPLGSGSSATAARHLPDLDGRSPLRPGVDRVEVAAVTRNRHRAAVLLGADDYDALRETIAVLAEKSLLADHLTGRAEIEAGASLDAAALAEIMSAGKPDDE